MREGVKSSELRVERRNKNQKGGRTNMKNVMKKAVSGIVGIGLIGLGLMIGMVKEAKATSISTNNTTALIVRITPRADRGVEISTGTAGLAATGEIELGTVEMGASTQTVNPATVTITGNMAQTEIDLSASITGGWSFQNDQVLTSTGANQLNAWVTFTSISTGAIPASNNTEEYFRVGSSSGAKLTSLTNVFSAVRVGKSNGSAIERFENNEDAADMDLMASGTKRHLWTFFRLPPTTSVTAPQKINIVLSTTDSNY